MKRFLEWIGLKEKIHTKENTPPLFKEREIWWCHVGENVGVEINGKSESFTRPILIFKKYDKYSFLGLPLSTKIKIGSWYAQIRFKGLDQIVIVSQARVFDYRRLDAKMGELEDDQLNIIRLKFNNLHIK